VIGSVRGNRIEHAFAKVCEMLGEHTQMRYKSNRRSIEHPFDTSRGATVITTAIVDQPSPNRLRPSAGGQQGRSATARGPLARPVRPAPTPPQLLADGAVRACRVDVAGPAETSWRLTDRGIALILALTAMIVIAAVTVIGLTAWRVTGPGYQPSEAFQVSRR
jgi:hypothetical protein